MLHVGRSSVSASVDAEVSSSESVQVAKYYAEASHAALSRSSSARIATKSRSVPGLLRS